LLNYHSDEGDGKWKKRKIGKTIGKKRKTIGKKRKKRKRSGNSPIPSYF